MSNINYKQLTIQNPDGEIIYCKHEDNNNFSITIPNTNTNTNTNNIMKILHHPALWILSLIYCNNHNFIFYLDLIIDIIGFYSASSFHINVF